MFALLLAFSLTAPAAAEFRIRLTDEPLTLNPLSAEGESGRPVLEYIFEPLLSLDDDRLAWKPRLARKYEVREDGRVVRFELRPDAKWSDGRPVTAQDVKFTFDAIFQDRFKAYYLLPFYADFREVRVISPRVVEFVAKRKYFGNLIQSASLLILPKHVYEKPRVDQPVGSGPYRLEAWTRGRGLALVNNPHWWGRREPAWKTSYRSKSIYLQVIKDDVMAAQMLKRGEIDYVAFKPEGYMRASSILRGQRVERVRNEQPSRISQIMFNLRDPRFEDRRVRRALARLVDRPFLVRALYHGHASPGRGPWYGASRAADPTITAPAYDPATAAAELTEAGWVYDAKLGVRVNGGRELAFEVVTAEPSLVRALTVVSADAAKAGVKIGVRLLDPSAYAKTLEARSFAAAATVWDGAYVDFDPYTEFHSAEGLNFTGYANARTDALLKSVRETFAPAGRQALLRAAYREIVRDAPYVFLLDETDTFYAVSARVKRERAYYRFTNGVARMWVDHS